MAAGDLTDLISRVREKGGFDADDAGLTDPKLTAFINAALKQVAQEHDWPWLKTSANISAVAGTSEYATPADWMRTDSLVIPDVGIVLENRDIDDLDRIIYRDRPALFAIEAEQVVLKPIPDAAYTIKHRYYRVERTLVSGADVPYMPSTFDEGIVEFATSLAFRKLRQGDKAVLADQAYQAWLKRTRDIVKRSRRPVRVSVRPGGLL